MSQPEGSRRRRDRGGSGKRQRGRRWWRSSSADHLSTAAIAGSPTGPTASAATARTLARSPATPCAAVRTGRPVRSPRRAAPPCSSRGAARSVMTMPFRGAAMSPTIHDGGPQPRLLGDLPQRFSRGARRGSQPTAASAARGRWRADRLRGRAALGAEAALDRDPSRLDPMNAVNVRRTPSRSSSTRARIGRVLRLELQAHADEAGSIPCERVEHSPGSKPSIAMAVRRAADHRQRRMIGRARLN